MSGKAERALPRARRPAVASLPSGQSGGVSCWLYRAHPGSASSVEAHRVSIRGLATGRRPEPTGAVERDGRRTIPHGDELLPPCLRHLPQPPARRTMQIRAGLRLYQRPVSGPCPSGRVRPPPGVRIEPVECLCGCKRACTVALTRARPLDLYLRRPRPRSLGRCDPRRRSPLRARPRTASCPGASAPRFSARASLPAFRPFTSHRTRTPMTDLAKIPCTIVTGFLGAGKTTLVRHLLENAGGRRLAVLVNEFGDIGFDGSLHRRLRHRGLHRGRHRRTAERLHLLHGCGRFRPGANQAPRPRRTRPSTS